MRHGSGKFNMTKPFAAHFRLRNFHAAFFADNSAIFHPLILATQTFVIFDRPKDLCAEQTITLRLERAVVDGLRLLNFTKRPFTDHLRASDRNLDCRETQWIFRLVEEIKQIFHVHPYFESIKSCELYVEGDFAPFKSGSTFQEPQRVPR